LRRHAAKIRSTKHILGKMGNLPRGGVEIDCTLGGRAAS
jgi:hypothetical protein